LSPILGIWASAQQSAFVVTGSYESISTVTVGSGGASDITFSSIPSTYKHLQIRGILRNSGSTSDIDTYIQFNGDTGNNYAWHGMYGIGSTLDAFYGAPNVNYINGFRSPGGTSSANMFGAGVVDIFDYANTNKYKTTRLLTGDDQGSTGLVVYTSGVWGSTSAITSIKFYFPTGNFVQYSQLALYGIKGA